MNSLKVFAFVALFVAVFAAEEAAKEAAKDGEETIKVYKRLIPADVLRGKDEILKEIKRYGFR